MSHFRHERKTSNHIASFADNRLCIQNPTKIEALSIAETDEALNFLAERPLHTVMMTGLIRDNGIVSRFNRGSFYACRNRQREIEGVALIGHLTMLETRTGAAKKALALKAKEFKETHLVIGEQERIEQFWKLYENGGQPARSTYRELLFSLEATVLGQFDNSPVRRARTEDLDLIVPVQAEMAAAESGVNPLDIDAEGFRRRCARRVEMGRTWIAVENNRLIFKTDVMVDTSEVSYIEGVYVAPAKRGQGFGSKCLSQVCRAHLDSSKSICLLVNELNSGAVGFYERIGFNFQCFYQHIFLQKTPALN